MKPQAMNQGVHDSWVRSDPVELKVFEKAGAAQSVPIYDSGLLHPLERRAEYNHGVTH
jgi:hypothetical protein